MRLAFRSTALMVDLPNVRLLALLVMVFAGAHCSAADRPQAKNKKADQANAFFADRAVRVFDIEISDAAQNLLRSFPRRYVAGTVREGAQVFTNIGIHLKGMGSFKPLDEKPSFVLKFDHALPEQEYCGLTKLMLNNSVQDQSYVAELLATGLFRDAGVPAARVTHARVRLNGRDLGLYVAIEGMNKRFLKHNFKNGSGNLYEGYLQDINRRLDQDNGEDATQADVRELYTVCRIGDLPERFKQLNQMLDVERFASFAAMEMLMAHWDGYTLKSNNFRLYHDPKSKKFVFIAHGLDAVFYRMNVPIQPPMRSIVSRALFETQEGRQLYEDRLRALYTNVFRLEVITNRMEQALSKLRAAALPETELAVVERKAEKLRERVAHRIARVAEQLAGIPPTLLTFDENGLARITEWRDEVDQGQPAMERLSDAGKTLLHIRAQDRRCRSSWRCMIFLKPGRYRFEGRVRTEGIVGAGADIRISGDTRYVKLTGNHAWQELGHDFTIGPQDSGDVELVCELYATQGEAWFDFESLRVRRVQPLP